MPLRAFSRPLRTKALEGLLQTLGSLLKALEGLMKPLKENKTKRELSPFEFTDFLEFSGRRKESTSAEFAGLTLGQKLACFSKENCFFRKEL